MYACKMSRSTFWMAQIPSRLRARTRDETTTLGEMDGGYELC